MSTNNMNTKQTISRIEQIRRAHKASRPNAAVNPAWFHAENDIGYLLGQHSALADALFDLVRYHEDGDYAEHLDARAKAASDGNVSALEALCATANAALLSARKSEVTK